MNDVDVEAPQNAWGHQVWVLLSVSLVRDDEGRPLHLIAQVQDISERKEFEGRLEQALAQEIKSAARYGGGGALLLLDLDHFKAVNDQFGHKAGDDLLKTVAAALRVGSARLMSWHGLGATSSGSSCPRSMGNKRTWPRKAS